MSTAITTVATLIVLALLVVVCGGVVPRQYQTWGVVLLVAIGLPLLFVLGSGLLGGVLG